MTDEEIGHEEKAVLGRVDHRRVEEVGTGSAVADLIRQVGFPSRLSTL